MRLNGKTGDQARLRASLRIDRDGLDEDVMQHPRLFDEVVDQYTIACSHRDEAKAELEETEAQLSVEVRRQFSKQKISNPEVANRVAIHRDYQRAQDKHLRLVKEAAAWNALREAYIQRGHMIRELCALFASGYWARSSSKGGAGREFAASRNRDGQKRYPTR